MHKYTLVHNFKIINITNEELSFFYTKTTIITTYPFSNQTMKPLKRRRKPPTRHRQQRQRP